MTADDAVPNPTPPLRRTCRLRMRWPSPSKTVANRAVRVRPRPALPLPFVSSSTSVPSSNPPSAPGCSLSAVVPVLLLDPCGQRPWASPAVALGLLARRPPQRVAAPRDRRPVVALARPATLPLPSWTCRLPSAAHSLRPGLAVLDPPSRSRHCGRRQAQSGRRTCWRDCSTVPGLLRARRMTRRQGRS